MNSAASLGLGPLCGRRFALEPQEAPHVVGQADHADFQAGARQADGSHEEPHADLLMGKDMLDGGADL